MFAVKVSASIVVFVVVVIAAAAAVAAIVFQLCFNSLYHRLPCRVLFALISPYLLQAYPPVENCDIHSTVCMNEDSDAHVSHATPISAINRRWMILYSRILPWQKRQNTR